MSTRTALPGTSTDGTVWTENDVNQLPGGWLGYVEITSSSSTFTSLSDISGLSVTVTVNSNRAIRITAHAAVSKTTNNGFIKGFIREGSTTLDLFMDDTIVSGGRALAEASTVILGPTGGSHTYKISMQAENADGQISASSTQKAWLLVEDIGPSS